MFTHVSQATRDVLAGCGMHVRTAGTGLHVVNEKTGSSHEGASRQVVTDAPREEETRHRPLPRSVRPGKLDMTMRKWRTIRLRPLLMIIDGGMA
jgi:hypothetical protein